MDAETYYFTPAERKQLPILVKTLLSNHRSLVSQEDIANVRRFIEAAVADGRFARDKYGLNPTIRHLHTATLLSEYIVPDRNMVIATLLYNLCKKSPETHVEVERCFGSDVIHIVNGLIKVSQLYTRQAAVADDNFHKLLLTFAEDIRVVIIMIVDRMALMRTINHHPDENFVHDISSEARYLYAPLAHRLGLYKIKSELEDLSLKYLNRKVYTQIANKLNETKTTRDHYIEDFIKPIRKELSKTGKKFEIKGRTKSINSIWNKMQTKAVDLNDIYDLFAIRIILDVPLEDEKNDCWLFYSLVTSIYTANPDRMKDWITIPKSNGYESLHGTVYGPENKWVEVQIRSRRMDEVAESGLAAHWKYKGIKSEGDLDVWMNNVREVLEAGSAGRMELIRDMKMNIYDKEVFVFTPKGDLFKLPMGSTILDFAFHIHSRIGSKCIGGRVDGKNQKISYKLKSGDTVEIITASTQTPRLDWLNYVVTSKARNKIKQAVNEARVKQAEIAKEMLFRRFKNRKIEIDEGNIARLLKRMGYKTTTDFYVAINEGTLDVNTVVEQYEALVEKMNEPVPGFPHGTAENFVLQNNRHDDHHQDNDILVIGNNVKGINYKLSKCCNPIFGDKIVGFIASDGAIKIHRTDCGNVRHLIAKYPYRVIKSQWTGKMGTQFAATLKVLGKDDIGIVSTITSVINKSGDNQLRNISINSQNGMFEGYLVIAVNSLDMLDDLIKKILTVKGVKRVERV